MTFSRQLQGALAESKVYYHGATAKAAQRIARGGFDLSLSGSRQRAMHGRTSEMPGIYLTPELSRARWYASLGHQGTKSDTTGGVVTVEVRGKLMSSREWWRLLKQVSDDLPGGMYDDENNRRRKREAKRRAEDRGFVGYVEHDSPEEVVVFDKKSVRVTGIV
jgi:hypothetical protein